MTTPVLRAVRMLLPLCWMLSAPGAFAQAQKLEGSVKGQSGDPKQFVTVALDGPARYVAVTNALGKFALEDVLPGHYAVRVQQGDYVQEFSREIRGERLDLKVHW